MSDPQKIDINLFDYILPDEKIPKYPLKERDSSRLLLYKGGRISETVFKQIGEHLLPGSLLVFNNTKVIHARLHFRKATGALIEVFCLEPVHPTQHLLALQATGEVTWNCIVGNLKKWKSGALKMELSVEGKATELNAEIVERKEGSVDVKFWWNNNVAFSQILEVAGNIPIPPYLNRSSEESDKNTYQTVYAEIDGSVAAPTAGLHFTKNVLNDLSKRGFEQAEVTLHVGAGTFQPVKSEKIGDHKMHRETIFVSKNVIEKLIKTTGPVIAVGTTSVRTLESLYWLGVKALKELDVDVLGQWEPYELDNEITVNEALSALLNHMKLNDQEFISSSTGIIIAPGYNFRIVQGIVTNFHQPRSTLLLLISAFVGSDWKNIYDYALNHDFRFLSYGDSSLLLK
ncbi:S-adenosylmethionine:tRNA ribosyltransferase-isomerase [Saccharicrinis sp. FJH54]|uniref:S-adenosylmethionine:tRNA ribosyltransferase-isomerase n=1 Tax=Saccharicrinis sp. FJH54 TaxID=3344665 RepID=UPI0035D4CAC9